MWSAMQYCVLHSNRCKNFTVQHCIVVIGAKIAAVPLLLRPDCRSVAVNCALPGICFLKWHNLPGSQKFAQKNRRCWDEELLDDFCRCPMHSNGKSADISTLMDQYVETACFAKHITAVRILLQMISSKNISVLEPFKDLKRLSPSFYFLFGFPDSLDFNCFDHCDQDWLIWAWVSFSRCFTFDLRPCWPSWNESDQFKLRWAGSVQKLLVWDRCTRPPHGTTSKQLDNKRGWGRGGLSYFVVFWNWPPLAGEREKGFCGEQWGEWGARVEVGGCSSMLPSSSLLVDLQVTSLSPHTFVSSFFIIRMQHY